VATDSAGSDRCHGASDESCKHVGHAISLRISTDAGGAGQVICMNSAPIMPM
jgi:hypothetical protein